jgi:hypothetical protein
MNNTRRKEIARVVAILQEVGPMIAEARDIVESVKDEEEEAHQSLPESLQDGERGQTMQEAIDALDEAHSALDEFDIDAITQSLETASA